LTLIELRGFVPIGLRPLRPTPRREQWNGGVMTLEKLDIKGPLLSAVLSI
jgi:hypothetical protein